MSDVRKVKRGRPPKKWPRRSADSITEFCKRTGRSKSSVFRDMKNGSLKYVQIRPGCERRIPYSEFLRLGFDLPNDDAA
jgi:hypothetical protein